jgi:hypothetical protein
VENNLAIIQKVKYQITMAGGVAQVLELPYTQQFHSLVDTPKNQKLVFKQIHVHRSTTDNGLKKETTQISIK